MNRSMCVFLWLSLISAPSIAFADTAVTNAAVVVENYPLRLVKYQDLNFGVIAPSGLENGTVLLSTGGQISATGGAALINPANATSAGYYVYGVPNTNFSVALPGEATLNGPSGTMTVRDFVSSNAGTDLIPPQGVQSFTIGATLNVPAGQLPGTYSGTFTVTVAYN